MRTLFIDTSSKDVSIAIIEDNVLINFKECEMENKHSIYVVPYIKELLDESVLIPEEINNIVVVNGPGSWTGIRIGLTIAKTYGYVLNKKVIPASSLKCIALAVQDETVISIIKAGINNYYFGVYDKKYKELISEQFGSLEKLIEVIDEYPKASIVSHELIEIANVNVKKISYNYLNIVDYYKEYKSSIHKINGNYLKLPQVLEEKNDKR